MNDGAAAQPGPTACFHCGEPCPDDRFARAGRAFCCQGCLTVHDLLAENGLDRFYGLSRHPGVRVGEPAARSAWTFLDDPDIRRQIFDFTDGKLARVTFRVPAIHCVACVWLLENLFRLHAGIGSCRVNFARREVSISFSLEKLSLGELAALLASIGYAPALTLGELDRTKLPSARTRQWVQIGIAGFAFGNIMLFSLPAYFGLDSLSGPVFKSLFGWLSLALALPVITYSASDYWKSAALSLRRKALTLDVPIAIGLAALYGQSAFAVISGRGEHYLDSLSGLVFFLLCGRAFQQKTHERLAFDRDYRSFFPLSVTRVTAAGEQSAAISSLRVGDRIVLRNGELIPADARLVQGAGMIDYSFVTGESEPVARSAGDHLYAGGRQIGAAIEIETVKPVSQSYLMSLWDHESFRKNSDRTFHSLTNRYSRRFTWVVLFIAIAAALYWMAAGDSMRALKAFTSVLIVACPCALALAAPFALGTAQRFLARAGVFLRNGLVLERMAQVNAVVFDKTGTLTGPGTDTVRWSGPMPLVERAANWIFSVARHSTHPHSRRLCEWLRDGGAPVSVERLVEKPGCGIEAEIDSRKILLGSRAWLSSQEIVLPVQASAVSGSAVHVAIDGHYHGAFAFSPAVRPEIDRLLCEIGKECETTLLSGDNESEREQFERLFGRERELRFNQSPLDKLEFVRDRQSSGKVVMMVGDGLNDAGALKQSDVGVAVAESVGSFSPASDVILDASRVGALREVLPFARKTARVVRLSFAISAAYNLIGISIAAAGLLSPIICAVLMPLSSISVVLFACGATSWNVRISTLRPDLIGTTEDGSDFHRPSRLDRDYGGQVRFRISQSRIAS